MKKNKKLIMNSDYDYYALKMPICFASNNSQTRFWDYTMLRNCVWQVAYGDDKTEFSDFVDFMCVAVRKNNTPDEKNDFVFYNNLSSENKGITLRGDAIGCACPPDDEIFFDFEKVDQEVERIDILISLFEAENNKMDFSPITKMRVRIESDKDDLFYGQTSEHVFQYDYAEFPTDNTVVKIGSLYKEDFGWKYEPIIEELNRNIIETLRSYGFNV